MSGAAERIIIVGAGVAGGNAAATLRDEGFRGRVVLIGEEPEIPYGRPPLSKTYLRNEEDLTAWYVRPREWYEHNDVEIRLSASVQHIDTSAQTMTLTTSEEFAYDRLILCTGGRAVRPEIPGMTLPGVHVLRTVADADAIKDAVRPGSGVVVAGMGFIGSEVAASLRQLGMDVSAVMAGAAPLDTVLGTEVGATMANLQREHGVELVARDRVVALEGSDQLECAVTAHGRRIACDMAVIGVGMEPNLAAVPHAIARDNGILVDSRCRTTLADVYAAGDVANHLHPLFGRVRVEHYNNAEKMGAAVARAVLGDPTPYAYVHSFWSDQYQDKLEYVGYTRQWDALVIRGSLADRHFLGFYLEGGVIRAAVGLNRGGDPELEADSELRACAHLIEHQVAVRAELLEDDTVPITALAVA